MVSRMLFKGRKLLSGRVGRPSLAGQGLLERMRSTTFALLGGTALFGLAIVAIMSQQGLPYLPSLPLPGTSSGGEEVSGAAVAERPQGGPAGAASGGVGPIVAPGRDGAGSRTDGSDSESSALATSHQIGSSPAPAPQSEAGQQGGAEAAPASPAPSSSPPAAEPPPPSNPSSTAGVPPSSTAAAAAVGSNGGGKDDGRKASKDSATSEAAKQAKVAAPKSSAKPSSKDAPPAKGPVEAAAEGAPPSGSPHGGSKDKDSGKDQR